MVDFVKKLIVNIESIDEQAAFLATEYNKLKDELFDLENYIPEEGSDFDKEMERIDAKIHSVNLKLRYLKDALIELNSLELIEKKDDSPKVQFTIHNEKIEKRKDDEEDVDYEEEDDDEEIEIIRDTSDVEEKYIDEDSIDDDEDDEEESDFDTIDSEEENSIEVIEIKEENIVQENEIIETNETIENTIDENEDNVCTFEQELYENTVETIEDIVTLDTDEEEIKEELVQEVILEEKEELEEVSSLDSNEFVEN